MTEFNTEAVLDGLNTKYIGRTIIYKNVTTTTMDDAENGAKLGQPNGTVYVADTQINARGYKGRSWNAKNSGNLYVSFVVHKDIGQVYAGEVRTPESSEEYDMDVAASLASLQALSEFGITGIKVKWLNDHLIKGHKLLGALVEYKGTITVDSKQKYLYIIGIGLNMNCDFRRDQQMCKLATSTFCETGKIILRELMLSRICNYLEKYLAMEREELMHLFAAHVAISSGDQVLIYMNDLSEPPEVYMYRGVTEDWSVKVEGNDGQLITLTPSKASMRCHPTKYVYILKDAHVMCWSYELLMRTCCALVDTTRFDIKYLMQDELTNGIPCDCALLIVGHLVTVEISDWPLVSVIHKYTKLGGVTMCFGNACSLFDLEMNTSHVTTEMALCKLTPLPLGKDNPLINVVTFQVESYKLPSNLELTSSTPLATIRSYSNGCIRRDEDVNQCSSENETGIIMCDIGKGKLCLCKPNLEVTYADLDEYFPQWHDNVSALQETVYDRDCLVMYLFNSLGIY